LDKLELHIESLIFASSKALTAKEIKQSLVAHLDTKIKDKEVEEVLTTLETKYDDERYSFHILGIAGGYQFMTKSAYYPLVSQFLRIESKKKLSKASLETLAIISYKQPITKSGMEAIRGVNCDYSVQKLLDKELVMIIGRAEGPGRPLLYATSEKFMNHFGLKSLKDLPKIKEFESAGTEIGLKAPEEGPAPEAQAEDLENRPSETIIEVPVVPEEVMEISDEEE